VLPKIKVLIVDDSVLVRQMLTQIINGSDRMVAVGAASDPFDAREKIKTLHPDVLTLDIEMPKMDGVTFLKNLMRLHPLPVIMISTLTAAGADVTLECLSMGAVDFITKPKIDLSNTLEMYADQIQEKIISASCVTKFQLERQYERFENQSLQTRRSSNSNPLKKIQATYHKKGAVPKTIVVIGASTGGTEAIKEVLLKLPEDMPPVLITQHIPEAFSKPFADRMNHTVSMEVFHAEHGQEILNGCVYIAPGNKHLQVAMKAGKVVCRLRDTPPVNRHKPSVEVMFNSVNEVLHFKGVAVMLTGMGGDGAVAMKQLRDSGYRCIIQDEKSSVVWGMPGEAFKHGAGEFVLPLEAIALKIVELVD
jgi:two-component system chemotaxis response regulator CheB